MLLRVLQQDNDTSIIAVSGVTTISNQRTAFKSFWMLDSKVMNPINTIFADSSIENVAIHENMYYFEFFHLEQTIEIKKLNEPREIFIISTDDMAIVSYVDYGTTIRIVCSSQIKS